MKVTEQDILSLIEEALSQSLSEQERPKIELTPDAAAAQARIQQRFREQPSWASGDEGAEWLSQFRNWATLNPQRAKRVNQRLEKAGVEGGLQASDDALATVASNLYGGRELRQTRPEWPPTREEGPEEFGGAPDPRVFIPGYNLGRRIKQGRAGREASIERGRGIRDPRRPSPAPEGKTNIDYFELMDAVEDGRINYRRLGDGDEEAGRARVSAALEQAYDQASDKVKADIDLSREQGASRRAARDHAGTFSYSGPEGASARDAQRAIARDYKEARAAVRGDDPTVFDLPSGLESALDATKSGLPSGLEGAVGDLKPPADFPIRPNPFTTRVAGQSGGEVDNTPGATPTGPFGDEDWGDVDKADALRNIGKTGDMGTKPEGDIPEVEDLEEQLGRWRTLAGLL